MLHRFSRLNLGLGALCSPAFVFDLVVITFFRVSFPSVIFSYFQSINDTCCWFRNRLVANGLLPWRKIRASFVRVTLSAGQDLEGRTYCCFCLSSRVERLTFLWGMTRMIYKINTFHDQFVSAWIWSNRAMIADLHYRGCLANAGTSLDRALKDSKARVNDWVSQW